MTTATQTTTTTRYTRTTAARVPSSIVRWDVPRPNQGQIVEVAYGATDRDEACHGDRWQRVTDRSLPESDPTRVTYYRRAR